MRPDLPAKDLILVSIVVLAWGSNFSAMKLALAELPPLLFVGLRFAILIPLIAVLPRPNVSWWTILGVGLLINTAQFAFLFSAMRADASAGLASLLLQAQVPFTILLSVLVMGETVVLRQVIGIGIAGLGMGVIGLSSGGSVTALGLILCLCGALSWALGNLILKRLRGVAMLPLFIWSSLVPPLPMLALSGLWESAAPFATIAALSPAGWGAVLYVALISTVLGYSLWGTVLARHPAARITPFALLIPVVGMGVAAFVLGERLTAAETFGAALSLLGLFSAVMGRKQA